MKRIYKKAAMVIILTISACLFSFCQKEVSSKEAMAYSVVFLYTEGGYGSGVILEINDEEIIVVSNLHVLSDWNENGYAVFANGTKAFGQIFGADQERDICFLGIPVDDILTEYGSEVIKELRSATMPDNLTSGFDFYTFSIEDNSHTPIKGNISDIKEYFYELDKSMMKGKCDRVIEGMSGAPIFNSNNELCGIIAAGGDNNTIAAISADDIMEALREAMIFG